VNGSPQSARGVAISDSATCVDGRQSRAVRKNNPTAIRNSSWIDRAMALLQSQTGSRLVLAGIMIRVASTVSPVNGDTSEQRIVAGKTVSYRR
jgi:hypothetical protein